MKIDSAKYSLFEALDLLGNKQTADGGQGARMGAANLGALRPRGPSATRFFHERNFATGLHNPRDPSM